MTVLGSARVRLLGLLALASLVPLAAACNNPFKPSQNVNVPFSVVDVTVGTGPEVVPLTTVIVDYAGYLYDGSKPNNQGLLIDTTLSKQPATFVVGLRQLLPGFEQGLIGMKLGGFRRIIIPPELGYGPFEHYPVPKNATLVFDVSLIGVALPQ